MNILLRSLVATVFASLFLSPSPSLFTVAFVPTLCLSHTRIRQTFSRNDVIISGQPFGDERSSDNDVTMKVTSQGKRCEDETKRGSGGLVAFTRRSAIASAVFFAQGVSAAIASETNVDKEYPGTAVVRMNAVRSRVAELAADQTFPLNAPWEDVRKSLLWAGGLRDLPSAEPGEGYTGHSFNDFNHVDLCTMRGDSADNQNDGSVKDIAVGNRLGSGIRIATIPELGPGGSWSTCSIGCNAAPPRDVAHLQFQSRIAFKLVWVPNLNYDTFVLVDVNG